MLPYRVTGENPDGSPITENYDATALSPGDTRVSDALGLSVQLRDVGAYTLLIAKHDPGQGIIWLAFISLIAGITITFYLPRRRVWTRLTADGRLAVVWRVGPLRRRRARVRAPPRRSRRGPPAAGAGAPGHRLSEGPGRARSG